MKRSVSLLVTILVFGLCTGCQINSYKQNQPEVNEERKELTSEISAEPTQVSEQVIYEKKIDSIEVTIRKEDKNKVHIKKDKNTAEFEWPFDLSFGTPIIKVDNNTLYIILPERDASQFLNVESVCGSVHKINLDTFKEIPYTDEVMTLKQQNEITFENYEYAESPDDGDFKVHYDSFNYYIKGFKYPVLDNYEVVLGDVFYYTDTLNEYRQLGIKQENNLTWLGKMCYDLTDESTENITFIPYQNLNYSKEQGVFYKSQGTVENRILSGEKIILDPDDSIDLDLDGKKEKISYERIENGTYLLHYMLTVNDASIDLEEYLADATATAVSLDGKSIQIMISTNSPSGADPVQIFYRYENSELRECGCIESYDFDMTNQGIQAYCQTYHIQFYWVLFSMEYKDGKIIKKEQEFYPQGTEVTTCCDIPLYKEKNSTKIAFTIKEGEAAIIVGSDLKEWAYVKEVSSGKCGWLRTSTEENNTGMCLLPDGTTHQSYDLFNGLDY